MDGKKEAIANIEETLNDINRLQESITAKDATAQSIAFCFGSYYDGLRKQLQLVLKYLNEDKPTA